MAASVKKTDVTKAAEEVKETVTKAAEQAKEAVAEETKKVATKAKASAEKTVKKATTAKKKATTKKKEVTKAVILQYAGNDYKVDEVVAKAEAAFKAENKRKAIEDIKVYIKPEENAAYYVVNADFAGRVDL